MEPRGANQTVAEHTGISHRLMKRRPTLPYYFQIRKVKVGHRPGFPESNGRCKVRGGSFTAVLCRLVSLGFTRRGEGGEGLGTMLVLVCAVKVGRSRAGHELYVA